MTDTGQPRMVRFGLFEVDLLARELRKNGVKIRLQEQPFQVLAILLQHAGDIVAREDFRRELWPADTFVDFEHSLNAAVKRLRDALGDSAENPLFIETLARRGYRFNAQVDGRTAQSPTAPSRILRRSHVLGLSCLAVGILVAALIWAKNYRGRVARGDEIITSMAVLPLENLSRDPDQDYFSDGMTDELIAQLSKIGMLRVISRTSVMRYKGTHKGLREIATELNVDGALEGTVMRSGNKVRIVVQLIDTHRDQHLWAESYERDLGDVLKLQAEVAQAVAKQVQIQLTPAQDARLRSAASVDPGAYDDYLKGRVYERGMTAATIKLAEGYFVDAVRKDPHFALAYVGLADCYLDLGTQRRLPPGDAYHSGNEAIQTALHLDQGLGEAHRTLGYLQWQYAWDWQAAEHELRYALALNPNSIDAHEALLWYLGWSGRWDETWAELGKMRQLDPNSPFLSLNEAGIYYHRRDYKSLVQSGQKAVSDNPSGWISHYVLAVGYQGTRNLEQAVTEYKRAIELSQSDSDAVSGLACAYAMMGRRREALMILQQLELQSKGAYTSPYMIAVIYSDLGEKNKAFEFLEKAYQERSPDLAYFLKADLRIDSLRTDPRFIDLLRRMNFPSS